MKRAGVLKAFRILLFSLVGLILLAALILIEEYFRGKWAWEKYKREAEARGVSFDPRPFIPPPVPDDQNFAMTPLLKPLFGADAKNYRITLSKALELVGPKAGAQRPGIGGMREGKRVDFAKWREYLGEQDLLHALKKFDPELAEISEAVRRPFARFPIPYDDGASADVSHLGPLMKFAQIYAIRSLAALEEGQTDKALADAESIFRLAESVRDEPLLISQLVRVSVLAIGSNVVWEGLESHRWSENQLAELQGLLASIDLFPGVLRSNQFERAILPEGMRKVLSDRKMFAGFMSFMADPSKHGFKYEWEPLRLFFKSMRDQNMLFIWRFDEEYMMPVIDLVMRRVDVNKIKAGEQKTAALRGQYNPYAFIALLRSSAVFPIFWKAAYAQTTVDQAVIASALERYRLAHGAFPDTLDALVPQYLTKLPHDIISGQPFHYHRTDDGLFLLYSVGWNETDDNGTVAMMKDSKRQDIKQGDWVWPHLLPAKKTTPAQ